MSFTLLPLKMLIDPQRPITYGIVQAGPDTDGGVPYIRPVDMTETGGVSRPSTLLRTTHEIARSYKRAAVREGDLVVSIGPSYGKVMIVPSQLAGANLTQGTARVSPASGVDARFLYWALQSSAARSHWDSAVGGATFRALNLEPLNRTPVPRPSLDEQRRIADFLDAETAKLDSIVFARQRQIELLTEHTKSLRDTLLASGDGVQMTRLMFLTESSRPVVYGIVQAGPDIPEGVPYIKTGDLPDLVVSKLSRTSEEIHRQYKRASVGPGDIVIAMRASIGAVAMVPSELPEANLTQGTARIAPAWGVHGAWLLEALQIRSVQQECNRMAMGSTFQTLNIGDLRRVQIPTVPSHEQAARARDFARASTPHRALASLLYRQTELLLSRREAMITAAVTGQFDVTSGRGEDLS